MKFLATLVLFIFFSLEGVGQHFLFNSNYSFHRFYDSGTYSLKQPGSARANLINLGVSYKWRHFDMGINANLGTLKNFECEGNCFPKSNVIGSNAFINFHFFKDELNYLINPYLLCGYGFKSVTLGSKLMKYYQASYGVGFNIRVSERVDISVSESFNLSFKNLYFNNLQTSVGLQLAFSKAKTKVLPEDYENLNQKIKEDSMAYVKLVKDLDFKWTYKERKLRDSLEKQIDFQKRTIEKLLNDKNTLLESSVTLKSQIDEIRKTSWTTYEVYKLTKDTLIKLDKLPVGDYATYTATYLPDALDRKKIVAIKGGIYICINSYNYYKICLEANSKEPIIPPDFLKYYPLAEVWKME